MSSNTPLLDSIILSCKSKNNLEDAKTFLIIAAKNCSDLEQLDHIAYLQSEIKDYKGCVESLKLCLSMAYNDQSKFAIRANAAKMYNHLNEPMMSLAYSKMNKEYQFDYDTLMEMSFSYYLMGNYAESEKMMRSLVADQNLPDEVRGRVEYNLGSYDIERGNFKKGLIGFIDVGHKIKIWHNRYTPNIPVWDGEDVSDKTVIIHAEGGIGDELINVRFVNNLKKLGATPIWVSNNSELVHIFNRNEIQSTQSLKDIDISNTVQCMAMYLPILLDLDKDQLWSGPYLKPSDKYLAKWQKILPEGKKIALRWSGALVYDQNLHRSLTLKHYMDLFASTPDITFVSVQRDCDLEQLKDYPNVLDLSDKLETLEDLLACISLVDHTFSSCTSTVHVAGSLGANVTVFPPIAAYYTWLGRTDNKSDWYGNSVTVIRQQKLKDYSHLQSTLPLTL
jgi:hypothetical protein